MTHIWVSKLAIIDSDNGRRQAIIWTNAGVLLIGPLETKLQWNLNRNLYIFIQENVFENIVWKMVAILSLPQCDNLGTHPIGQPMKATYGRALRAQSLI